MQTRDSKQKETNELELFAQAIKASDIPKLKTLLTPARLNEVLPFSETKCTALELALQHNQIAAAEFLLECGATDLKASPKLRKFNSAQIELNFTIVQLITQFEQIKKKYPKEGKDVKDEPCKIVKMIAIIERYLSFERVLLLSVREKMDFIFLLKPLLQLINAGNSYAFDDQVQAIFTERENHIKGTGFDYCYDPESCVNSFSVEIANLFKEKAPYNFLYKQACTQGRKEVWYNPIEVPRDIILPPAKDFFRTKDNEINIYEQVVDAAVGRIKDGVQLLEHIWYGTDDKLHSFGHGPSLTSEQLTILEQRSPSLKQLVSHTKRLDHYARLTFDVVGDLTELKSGLYEGGYTRTNDHKNAGEKANAAVAQYFAKFNQYPRQLQEAIKAVRPDNSDESDTLGRVINIFQYEGDLHNNERQNNSVYCVHLKGEAIERFLFDRSTLNRLQALNTQYTNYPENSFHKWSHHKLDQTLAKIKTELQTPSKIFIYPQADTSHVHEINAFFIKCGLIQSHRDLISGSNKHADADKIINYIFKIQDPQLLDQLRTILNRDEMNYLRQFQGTSSTYYAMVYGERVESSRSYAMIEKALSLQLIKLNVQYAKSKEAAQSAVQKLCNTYHFIDNHRRFKFHIFGTKTANMFNARFKNLEECTKTLDDEIANFKR